MDRAYTLPSLAPRSWPSTSGACTCRGRRVAERVPEAVGYRHVEIRLKYPLPIGSVGVSGVELPHGEFSVVAPEPLDGLGQSPLLGQFVEEEDLGEEAGVAEGPTVRRDVGAGPAVQHGLNQGGVPGVAAGGDHRPPSKRAKERRSPGEILREKGW